MRKFASTKSERILCCWISFAMTSLYSFYGKKYIEHAEQQTGKIFDVTLREKAKAGMTLL